MMKTSLKGAVWPLLVAVSLAFASPAVAQAPADERARTVIADLQRHAAPESVQELIQVNLGGVDQWVSIRGADARNPILLYIHGGPGRPMMPAAWTFQRPWEDYFTVVQWDQRGAGKSQGGDAAAAVRETLSFDRITADAVELMAYLRQRFGAERIFVLGHSWGGAVALNAALRRPEWVHAYIGLSPLLSSPANERASYRLALAEARRRADAEALAELEALAPYPGEPTLARIEQQRKWVVRYGGLAAHRDNASSFFGATILAPEYDAEDMAAINDGSFGSVERLLPELSVIDLTTVRRVDFPVIMLLGRHDMTTPPEVAVDWLARLEAPAEHVVWFERSAHLAPLEEPGRVLVSLVEVVRPYAEAR